LYPGYKRWWGIVEWNSRTRLVDEVVEELRKRIYEGRYSPGTRLRQEEIAAELDVSRTPLREAFRKLESEGFVSVSPGRGVRVLAADPESLLAAYEFREVVDGLAARLSALRSGEGLLDTLSECVDRQRRSLEPWEPKSYTEANVEFHAAIFEASRNRHVVAQLRIMRITAQVFTPVELVSRTRAESAIEEHRLILEAIRTGDAEDAERKARLHIRRTIETLPGRDV
jgi:DNA-binding GntR family transcriptional regulator